MPTISVNRDNLFKLLGRKYTEDEFDELCFDYGLELDEVTSEKEEILKEQGNDKAEGASEEVIYKIDVPANRTDLLCIEGLVMCLKVFLQQSSLPNFQCLNIPAKERERIIMTDSTQQIRKYCVGAVLRNISITKEIYDSFIDLQDKLHHNIGRKRTLVSIGTHDLDTINGPYKYDAQSPEEIKFVALNQSKEHSASELMELYSKDSHLKGFLHIIKDSPVYPIIYDRDGIVLSMPPIINGNHSKIKLTTKNIFIEVTATDLPKAKTALDTLVMMFSCYCKHPFQIEPVDVVFPDGTVLTTPELPYREEIVSSELFNKKIGINISADEAVKLLSRMCLKSEVEENSGSIKVTIPPSRSDIIHACDIVEDVAIAYGFNNIVKTFPRSVTVGRQQLSMKLSERLRVELASSGFTEALTFALCSRDDVADKMRQVGRPMQMDAVHIENPKTLEFQVIRTSLLPGLLKTVASNRKMALPLKLFEVQEVVLKDSTRETGARNERRLAVVHYNVTPGFEVIHGLLDRVMQILEVKYLPSCSGTDGYYIKAADDPSFLKQRCADVIYCGESIGKLGVLHPEVIANFDLPNPAAALEINLEKFYKAL